MRKYKDFMSEPDYGYIDIESCFDPIFEPPIDFLEECRKRWENRMNPFTGTVERKIGNTWYLLETVIEVTEEWLETQETMSADVDAFVALTQKYVDVPELTPTIVNENDDKEVNRYE